MLQPAFHSLRVLGSVVNSTLNGWRGCMVIKPAQQPDKPLVLYDMEGCPYCRRVREVLSALHLDADIRPCPKGGRRFRAQAEAIGGKQQFPLLVDENTGRHLYESADIVDYLFQTYLGRSAPGYYRMHAFDPPLGSLATAASGLRGIRARSSRTPDQPLHLWSFEGSPYSRLVRENLCELEIPYRVHNLGKEEVGEMGPARRRLRPGPYVPRRDGKRAEFYARHQHVQVPYLEDPNTGAKLFESADIVDYLEKTYAA